MPEEVAPIVRLDTLDTCPFELACKVLALRLRCSSTANRGIAGQEIAFHLFAELCKERAFSNTSATSDHNKTSASFV